MTKKELKKIMDWILKKSTGACVNVLSSAKDEPYYAKVVKSEDLKDFIKTLVKEKKND
jgi:hypothetical protein